MKKIKRLVDKSLSLTGPREHETDIKNFDSSLEYNTGDEKNQKSNSTNKNDNDVGGYGSSARGR